MAMDGRGRYYRWSKRTTTGELFSVDVQKLAKDGGMERHTVGFWQWTWTGGRESGISYEVKPGQGLRLMYTSNGKPFDYLVCLVTTLCHYGGWRYWWLCPNCSRRCRILYGQGLFVCRPCSGAYYATQVSKDLVVRIDNELRRLRIQLKAKSFTSEQLPAKPHRMHWRTYRRLTKRIADLQYYRALSLGIGVAQLAESIGIRVPGSAAEMQAQLQRLLGEK